MIQEQKFNFYYELSLLTLKLEETRMRFSSTVATSIVLMLVSATLILPPTSGAIESMSSSGFSSSGSSDSVEVTTPSVPAPLSLQWQVEEIELDLQRGGSKMVTAEAIFADAPDDIEARIEGDLREFASVNSVVISDDENLIQVLVEVGATADIPDEVTGYIVLHIDGSTVEEKLPLRIAVTEFNDTEIPYGTTFPSADRIGSLDGITVVDDEIIVEIREEIEDPDSAIKEIARTSHSHITGSTELGNVFTLRREGITSENLQEYVEEIAHHDQVKYSFINPMSTMASISGNGPEYIDAQKNLLDVIDAEAAWEMGYTGNGVEVSIIDSGVKLGHEDIRRGENRWGDETFSHAHGTHVAGISCARGNNGIGITGVAPDCSVNSFNVFGYRNKLTSDNPRDWALSGDKLISFVETWEAMRRAGERFSISEQSGVVNLSFGKNLAEGEECTPAARFAVNGDPNDLDVDVYDPNLKAVTPGQRIAIMAKQYENVLFVFAAGNQAIKAECFFGAAGAWHDVPNIMNIAALSDNSDILSETSNFGWTIDVAAPGTEIVSTVPYVKRSSRGGSEIFEAGDGYATYSGTSMAAPVITGIAALMLEARPNAQGSDLAYCVREGAKAFARPNSATSDTRREYPIANAVGAVECITESVPSPDSEIPVNPAPRSVDTAEYFAARTLPFGDWPTALATADVNEDGYTDVLIADEAVFWLGEEQENRYESHIRIALGGPGGFQEPQQSLPVPDQIVDVALADMDNDGHVDLVAASRNDREIRMYQGRGDGSFSFLDAISTNMADRQVELFDANQDGLIDILLGSYDEQSIGVLLQQPDGTFTEPSVTRVNTTVMDLGVGDFNSDGIPDVIAGGSIVWLGNGDGTFTSSPKNDEKTFLRHTVGDLNQDGIPDVVAAAYDIGSIDSKVVVYFGNENGTLQDPVVMDPIGPTPYEIIATDIDSDGDLDIVYSDYNTYYLEFIENIGSGEFAPAKQLPAGTGMGEFLGAVSGPNSDQWGVVSVPTPWIPELDRNHDYEDSDNPELLLGFPKAPPRGEANSLNFFQRKF